LRLLHTIRHLRPRQIAYQLLYRATKRMSQNGARTQVQSALGAEPALLPMAESLKAPANALPIRLTEAGFCFLNQAVKFSSFGAIDWNFADNGKLWTYNLNYFEYLRQPGFDSDDGELLIGSWITQDTTHIDGWEPYTLSLRLVNWLQFYRAANLPIPARVLTSIRRQYVDLWRKVEYHLGGNHLLENAIALALTARYLNDASGQRKADRLLRAELKEQYLPDGAHYERSIMYHLILLWRQLDLYSWTSDARPLRRDAAAESPAEESGTTSPTRQTSQVVPPASADELRLSLQAQLSWANSVITPDGRYPHFNDSTDGIAPAWSIVQDFAEALGLGEKGDSVFASPSPGKRGWAKAPAEGENIAGYHHWSTPTINLWIDAGAIGPDYIPGHAHADNLTFVLHHNGQPIIVDPAITTYEKNARRALERSTAAHNTVTINDDQNSSDVWGGFRVGKRAQTTVLTNEHHQLTASHNGFGDTTHTRYFSLSEQDNHLTIVDTLEGEVTSGVSRLHFAPGLTPVLSGNTMTVGSCSLLIDGADRLSLFDYQCGKGYNQLVDGVGLKVIFASSVKVTVAPGD
jgi:hypothetical protein